MNLRIKTGALPGDVSKHTKQAMLEEKHKKQPNKLLTSPVWPLTGAPAKAFRKEVRLKEKAVLKRRARKIIKEGLEP